MASPPVEGMVSLQAEAMAVSLQIKAVMVVVVAVAAATEDSLRATADIVDNRTAVDMDHPMVVRVTVDNQVEAMAVVTAEVTEAVNLLKEVMAAAAEADNQADMEANRQVMEDTADNRQMAVDTEDNPAGMAEDKAEDTKAAAADMVSKARLVVPCTYADALSSALSFVSDPCIISGRSTSLSQWSVGSQLLGRTTRTMLTW